MEQLVAKLKLLIPDLLDANGILPKAYDSVPFHLHTEMNDVAVSGALIGQSVAVSFVWRCLSSQ